jgi:hypothetical protein
LIRGGVDGGLSKEDAETAFDFGVKPTHAIKIGQFCAGKSKFKPRARWLIIIRSGNPKSLLWHGVFTPKPHEAWRGKTNDLGIVMNERTVGSPSGGTRKELVAHYGDYDMQGVYEERSGGDRNYFVRFPVGNAVNTEMAQKQSMAVKEPLARAQIDQAVARGDDYIIDGGSEPGASPFLRSINLFVCGPNPNNWMFQHGANDDLLVSGRPVLDPTTASTSGASAAGGKKSGFVIFTPDGGMRFANSWQDLKQFYRNNKISWPYAN